MKTIDDYLEILGLSTNSSLDDILAKAEEYKAVTTNEINGIKTISVMPLPNVVQNKSTELKQRMTNIVSDDSKGAVAIVNIRFALVYLLMQKVGQIQTDLDNDEDAIEQLEELLNQRVKITVQKDGSSSTINNNGDKIELNVISSSMLLVNSTEIKQTANFVTLKATDGTNTNTLAITPQSININGVDVVVEDDLTAEKTARQDADTNLQNQITQLGLDLDAEEDARSNADTSLQSQIDAINAAQNLADIVADLTALNNYDTSVLEANDKVEVLSDSDHDYSATVYNWSGSAWQYIGKYGDSYSKAESDAKYVNLTGTQTISGSKTFTNNTDWNFGDSDIVDFNKFEYRFSHDKSFTSFQDGHYASKYQKAENNPDDCVEQHIDGTNLYVRTEISNNGKTSQDYMSNTQREIYIVNDKGNNSMRVGNSYAYLDDHYENDNYSSLGQVGISNNKPYINWELTSKNNNSTSWQTMINFWYRGLHLYTANKNTYDYSEIELGDESIKLSVSNEDDYEGTQNLILTKHNGLTLNGNNIIDTANASTELFMTDAEMDTLISEVFN